MRFEYDPPSPFLLVGGYGLLVFTMRSLQQTSNIPMSRTPLGLLLQDNLKLSGGITVSQLVRYPGQLQVTLYRTASPSEGTLTLVFADQPLALRSWIVVDAQRRETPGRPVRRPARLVTLRPEAVQLHRPEILREPLAIGVTAATRIYAISTPWPQI